MALRITARPWCNSLAISRIDLRFRKYSRRMISFWSTVIISSTPLAKMSLSHLVTKRAATVVPFSMAKTPSTGPVFYDHTHTVLFAILVGLRVGKGGIATQPKELEPGAVTLHQGSDKWKSAVGGMDVPRSQLCPQTIALAGKAKKRMETVRGKMTIVGNPFLLAVGRVLGGIQIDYKPLFVLPL